MNNGTKHPQWALLIFVASLIATPAAKADAVCDWNTKAGEIVVSARWGRHRQTARWRSSIQPSTKQ